MSWIEIEVVAQDEREAEAVAEVLQLFALDGEWVATEQLGDPNDVRADAMLSEMRVKLAIGAERDSEQLRQQIGNALAELGLPSAEFSPVDEQEWATAWRDNFHALRIGERFVIRPSWEHITPQSDDLIITLDPGNAFGTGTHETTQLCLARLETLVQPGVSLLDLGCGSGILAIGAAMLGASPVLAVDIDDDSVTATEQNAAENGVGSLIETRLGSLDAVERRDWDVLVANILAPTLITMLRDGGLLSYIKPDGVLLLSGILGVQSAEMHDAIEATGGVVSAEISQGEWIALVVTNA